MTFLPWQEVDQRDCNGITWHQWIPEEKTFCKSTAQNTWLPWLQKHCKLHIHDCLQCGGFPEGERLDGIDVVPIVAGNSGQARLPQLTKLRLREWLRVCIRVVVESEKRIVRSTTRIVRENLSCLSPCWSLLNWSPIIHWKMFVEIITQVWLPKYWKLLK